MNKRRPPQSDTNPVQHSDEPKYDSPLLLLTRMYWFFIGPSFALMAVVAAANNTAGWLTGFDVFFFVLLALIPSSRWLEFRLGKAETVDGAPASAAHLRNYTLVVLAAGALGWATAKLIGTYLLAG